MTERVRDILESVKGERQGPYQDAVNAARKRPGANTMAGLQREILGEMAAALGRAEEHVTTALAELARLDKEIEACAPGRELDRLNAAYEAERQTAERRLWELMVHREALGLRSHDILAELYPVPKRRVTSR